MAWLAQDDGDLEDAERLLREVLFWHEQGQNTEILVAQTLADLGDVLSARGDLAQADACFQESLVILEEHKGQYDRQEARTLLKYGELQIRQGKLDRALELLDQADDKVRLYGHYFDLMWRIELARASVYARQGHFRRAYRKWQTALRYRRALGLPIKLLVRQLFGRLVGRAKLLRELIRASRA
jgi:tetratricopeptide (TPR) repeat protein